MRERQMAHSFQPNDVIDVQPCEGMAQAARMSDLASGGKPAGNVVKILGADVREGRLAVGVGVDFWSHGVKAGN